MIEKILTVQNRAGIHARPAAIIAQTANKFEAEITLTRDDTSVNAKSIMGMMSLVLTEGQNVIIAAEGPDEEDACNGLEEFFHNNI